MLSKTGEIICDVNSILSVNYAISERLQDVHCTCAVVQAEEGVTIVHFQFQLCTFYLSLILLVKRLNRVGARNQCYLIFFHMQV